MRAQDQMARRCSCMDWGWRDVGGRVAARPTRSLLKNWETPEELRDGGRIGRTGRLLRRRLLEGFPVLPPSSSSSTVSQFFRRLPLSSDSSHGTSYTSTNATPVVLLAPET